jgi:hypothetical protein
VVKEITKAWEGECRVAGGGDSPFPNLSTCSIREFWCLFETAPRRGNHPGSHPRAVVQASHGPCVDVTGHALYESRGWGGSSCSQDMVDSDFGVNRMILSESFFTWALG